MIFKDKKFPRLRMSVNSWPFTSSPDKNFDVIILMYFILKYFELKKRKKSSFLNTSLNKSDNEDAFTSSSEWEKED